MAAIAARSADKRVSYHDLHNLCTGDLLFYEKKKIKKGKISVQPHTSLCMHVLLIMHSTLCL